MNFAQPPGPPLVVLWENGTDHKLLSVSGFTEKKGLEKKKPELASLDGLLVFV